MSNDRIDTERGLISKILEEGMLVVKDKQIKPYYLDKVNRPILTYLNDFYNSNGTVPTLRVFKQKFPLFKYEVYINPTTLTESVGTDEPMTYWCDEIRKRAKHNKIVDAVEDIATKLEEFETEEAYSLLKKSISYIENSFVETQAIDITKDSDDRKALYLKRKENKGMIGISMGIDRLDYILKGMQPKQLITLLAKTGVGKTWFLLLICAYAILNGYRCIFFTTEMSEEQIEDRLEAILLALVYGEDFNYAQFKSGTLSVESEAMYFDFLDMKSKLEPCIIETATSPSNVRAKIDQHKADLVFVDSAYLMQDDQGSDQDWLRIAHITRDLKGVAKATKKPVFINTQADKNTSSKTGPELENINFSQSIGQDSDVVMALFRDDQMKEDNEMKVKILKQREGTLGNVMLNWNFDTMNFSPIYSSVDGKMNYDPSKIVEEKSKVVEL